MLGEMPRERLREKAAGDGRVNGDWKKWGWWVGGVLATGKRQSWTLRLRERGAGKGCVRKLCDKAGRGGLREELGRRAKEKPGVKVSGLVALALRAGFC